MRTVKGTPKHLSSGGELAGFTYLMLNLEFGCNYRCRKCFNLEDGRPPLPKEPVSPEKRLGLIAEAKELGGKVVVIAGEGEPTLDRNIKSIVGEAGNLDMIPIVYSNGSTLSPQWIEFYRDSGAVLVVSLDSLNPATYDYLTRTSGMLPDVLGNLENLRDAYRGTKETCGDMEVLRLAVNTTINSHNLNEAQKIKERFRDDFYFICNPLAKSGNAKRRWNELVSDKKDYQKQQELARDLSESGGPLTLGADGLCGYSRWGISVSTSGYYMTCAYTSKTNGLLGHVASENLGEAFERKHGFEGQHYERYGNAPCLMRMPSFGEYVWALKNDVSPQFYKFM